MARQLVLIETNGAGWRLDELTRDAGRRGVAAAREQLRKVAPKGKAAAA
ncbi:MAG: hypothetical protein ACRD0D_10115 [Acidimicrobiales bacterium]